MDKIKKSSLFRVISLALIAAFISLDISYAYPPEDNAGNSTLSTPSILQQTPVNEQAARLQQSVFSQSALIASVYDIGEYFFGNVNKSIGSLPSKYAEEAMRADLGKHLSDAGTEILNIVPVEYIKETAPDKLKSALDEIGFKGTLPGEGVVFILYKKGDKKFLVQIARKDRVSSDSLPDYEWLVSDKYVVKYIPGDYEAPQAEAIIAPPIIEVVPLIPIEKDKPSGIRTVLSPMRHSSLYLAIASLIISIMVSISADGEQVTSPPDCSVRIDWDESPSSNIATYKAYYGTSSRNYTSVLDAGLTNTVKISGLKEGVTLYFAVTASNIFGMESDYSEEIDYTPASAVSQDRPPRISNIMLTGNGNVELTIIRGDSSFFTNATIEYSTDLLNWSPPINIVLPDTINTWIDDGTQTGDEPSKRTKGFYRLKTESGPTATGVLGAIGTLSMIWMAKPSRAKKRLAPSDPEMGKGEGRGTVAKPKATIRIAKLLAVPAAAITASYLFGGPYVALFISSFWQALLVTTIIGGITLGSGSYMEQTARGEPINWSKIRRWVVVGAVLLGPITYGLWFPFLSHLTTSSLLFTILDLCLFAPLVFIPLEFLAQRYFVSGDGSAPGLFNTMKSHVLISSLNIFWFGPILYLGKTFWPDWIVLIDANAGIIWAGFAVYLLESWKRRSGRDKTETKETVEQIEPVPNETASGIKSSVTVDIVDIKKYAPLKERQGGEANKASQLFEIVESSLSNERAKYIEAGNRLTSLFPVKLALEPVPSVILSAAVLILAGPSGAGKSTYLAKLQAKYPDLIYQPPLTTTRKPRDGEKEGEDYHFVTENEFKRMEEAGEILFSRRASGCYYGTYSSYANKILEASRNGKITVFETNVAFAVDKMLKVFPSAKVLTVLNALPGDFTNLDKRDDLEKDLIKRLGRRSSMVEEELKLRAAESIKNVPALLRLTDLVVINSVFQTDEHEYDEFENFIRGINHSHADKYSQVKNDDNISTLNKNMATAEIRERVQKAIETIEKLDQKDVSPEIRANIESLKKNLNQFEADGAVGSLIVLARKAKKEDQKLIIGLETDWIPGINVRNSLQRQAITALMKEIDGIAEALQSMGLDNVEVVRDSGEKLASAILSEAEKTHTRMHNIIVMASANTINSDSFAALRNSDENDRPFLTGIDPTELIKLYTEFGEAVSKQLYIRLASLLYMTLELAAGKESPQSPIIVSYDKKMRVLILLPRADPIDYETLKNNYAAEMAALQAA